MLVECLVCGPFQENCYLAARESGAECVVIDPGDEAERIAARIEDLGLQPVLILNTHGHLDHIGAVPDLRERYAIPFAVHPADRFLLQNVNDHAAMFGLSGYRDPVVDRELRGGETVEAAGLRFRVTGAPGHSPGHVVLAVEGEPVVFVGDVVFAGSIGRMDLPGGDEATMKRTLREVILTLEDGLTLYPGHGPATTVGAEREHNPYLNGMLGW
ncbi:MAG: MBL fold metallo-hydrolase [Planctomycetota bacterium]